MTKKPSQIDDNYLYEVPDDQFKPREDENHFSHLSYPTSTTIWWKGNHQNPPEPPLKLDIWKRLNILNITQTSHNNDIWDNIPSQIKNALNEAITTQNRKALIKIATETSYKQFSDSIYALLVEFKWVKERQVLLDEQTHAPAPAEAQTIPEDLPDTAIESLE